MSSFLSKLGRFLPSRLPRSGGRPRAIGKDLAGNTYFEIENANGGRAKRTVEYVETGNNPLDYRSGTQQLPVQWTAWMSHTRDTPPTMEELKADYARQMALRERVAAIEERERAERIEQGYLREDGSEIGHEEVPRRLELGGPVWINVKPGEEEAAKAAASAGAVSGPASWSTGTAGVPHASAKFAFPPRRDSRRAARMQRQAEVVEEEVATEQVVEEGVKIAPPRAKVDALSQDPAELRKLAEEDTKRRMRESGVEESTEGERVEPAAFAPAPRRRGGK